MTPKPLSGASTKVTNKSTSGSSELNQNFTDLGGKDFSDSTTRPMSNSRTCDAWIQDCADTVVWLRENQRRFRFPILEPPCLSISVKDQRYINAVDTLISHDTMKVL
jgi:hypothetical protein